MATPTYQSLRDRQPYGDTAGARLIAALERVGLDPFTSGQAIDEGDKLGLSPTHTRKLLHLLAASAWLTRLKKGVYAINDTVTRQPKAHPFAIGAALVSPSAISHWSALQHWGLTEQIPATVMVSSPRRTFPPPVGSGDGRAAWIVGDVRYQIITVTPARFFGVTRVWLSERSQVPLFDRERALLDAFHHFHVFGSLSTGLDILETHVGDLDVDRLVRHALRLRIGAVVKRLGWALERLHVEEARLKSLQGYPVREELPLDPGRPARGRHNSTWQVIENLHDGR